MPHNRFFTPVLFKKGQTVVIKDEEAHHMHVMRIQKAQEVELINGKKQLAKASVINLSKNQAELKIKHITNQSSDEPQLILAPSFFKFSRLKWMVEKTTELGVTSYWFFPSALSEKKELKRPEKQKLERSMISAIKQSGRLELPTIEIFDGIENLPQFNGPQFLADPSENSSHLSEALKHDTLKKEALIFIGPEKGFDKKEISFFEIRNAIKTRLSENILRSETACIVSVAFIHSQLKSASTR